MWGSSAMGSAASVTVSTPSRPPPRSHGDTWAILHVYDPTEMPETNEKSDRVRFSDRHPLSKRSVVGKETNEKSDRVRFLEHVADDVS